MKLKGLLLTVLGLGMLWAASPVLATTDYGVNQAQPLKVNRSQHTVYLATTVNRVYTRQPTRHLIVNEKGTNANKSLLQTKVTPQQFYKALKQTGATPGNNLTLKSKPGTTIGGTTLKVSFVINGKKVAAQHAIQVKGKDAPDLDFRFGGNKTRAAKIKTGCMICFDSCPVGIASGATYGYQYGAHFTGKASVLPEDGQQLVVVCQVVKSCCE